MDFLEDAFGEKATQEYRGQYLMGGHFQSFAVNQVT